MKRSDMDRGDILAVRKSSYSIWEPALILDVDQLWREHRTFNAPTRYKVSDATRYKVDGSSNAHGILAVMRFDNGLAFPDVVELLEAVTIPGPVGSQLTQAMVDEIQSALPKGLWLQVINPKQADGTWKSYWEQKTRSDEAAQKRAVLVAARDEKRAALWSKVEELVDFGPFMEPDAHGKVTVSVSLLAILLGLGDEVDEEPSETINHRMVFSHVATEAEIEAQDLADEGAELGTMDRKDLEQYLTEIPLGSLIKAKRADLVNFEVQLVLARTPEWTAKHAVKVTNGQHTETVLANTIQVIDPDPRLADLRTQVADMKGAVAELRALEAAGVDNWVGYDQAMATLDDEVNDADEAEQGPTPTNTQEIPPREFDQVAAVDVQGFHRGHLVKGVEAYSDPSRDVLLRLTKTPTQNSPLTVILSYGLKDTITVWAQSVKLVEEGTQSIAHLDIDVIRPGDLVEFEHWVSHDGGPRHQETRRIRINDDRPYANGDACTLFGDIGPIAAITSSLRIVDTLA